MTEIASAHAPSYYAASVDDRPARPALAGAVRADVAIVGGGFTGLNAAITLAEAGRSVVLIEQNRIGWGASGRNGGQLHSGQRRDQVHLEKQYGLDTARRLWTFAEEAKALLHERVQRFGIDCDWTEGLIHAAHKERFVAEEWDYAEKLARDYGYDAVTRLDRAQLAAAIGTKRYFGGTRDGGAGHLHPLKLAQGLADAAEAAGAVLHEATHAVSLRHAGGRVLVETGQGEIDAGSVLLAGNGYLAGLDRDSDARVMPINNYVLTTEPLSREAADHLIPGREAVSDSRFVVYYWRLTRDLRLLFGGGETYRRGFPPDLRAFVRSHLNNVYPQLATAPVSHVWGGTLGVTTSRMPCLRRTAPGVYVAAGFSGHGVAMAGFCGHAAACAMLGDAERFDVFAQLSPPKFPGGRAFRWPILVLAMSWFALRDRLW
ncbi:NAD(P)/FAD-dependent oxidoreductase [Stappia indica]|uniref:NAD(P)/FAD-dependent oxidoreductase n=1 Tax=Stappia indica TaxID=538381 RepID=UPI001FD3C28F|nr:FAD-binding oxidoreductase [Stappia indica]